MKIRPALIALGFAATVLAGITAADARPHRDWHHHHHPHHPMHHDRHWHR